jgi:protein-disulfide isomerase
MMPGGIEVEIDLSDAPVAGDGDAPVEVVLYACARCPFCSRVIPQLLEAVRSGPLEGKARLFFRTFPIRGHPFSKEGGLAFVAAHRQGKFWEFLLETYGDFDGFCVDALPQMAETAGMDRAIFEQHYADPATREALVESKKEGLRNGVDVTPSVFLNRRRYLGDASFEELVDVIGEEYERMRGEICLAP